MMLTHMLLLILLLILLVMVMVMVMVIVNMIINKAMFRLYLIHSLMSLSRLLIWTAYFQLNIDITK
ncbi:hypothetical protein BDF14DRAFT_1842058 [Spinellus fusiger]|nr:hypothetical protein BDF14DRAFT_1842058 [Spinellus fusiger]